MFSGNKKSGNIKGNVTQTTPGGEDKPLADSGKAVLEPDEATPPPVIPQKKYTTKIIGAERIMQFPEDISLGILSVGRVKEDGTLRWEKKGEAKGAVTFLSNAKVRLSVSETGLGAMGILQTFRPDDFFAVELVGDSVVTSHVVAAANLTDLQELNLFAPRLKEDGYKEISKIQNLRKLTLQGCVIQKPMINQIITLSMLEYLDVRDTRISDSSASMLVSMKTLRILKLDNQTVTRSSLILLNSALPDCAIWPEP